jgi:hypothetical protein
MPFGDAARLFLRNDATEPMEVFAFIEYQRLPSWDAHLGYLHAAWLSGTLTAGEPSRAMELFVEGEGHYAGYAASIAGCVSRADNLHPLQRCTLCIANDGRPDAALRRPLGAGLIGGHAPAAPFAGLTGGVNLIESSPGAAASVYELRGANVAPYGPSLTLWMECASAPEEEAPIEAAITHYWYAADPGCPRPPLPSAAERVACQRGQA